MVCSIRSSWDVDREDIAGPGIEMSLLGEGFVLWAAVAWGTGAEAFNERVAKCGIGKIQEHENELGRHASLLVQHVKETSQPFRLIRPTGLND